MENYQKMYLLLFNAITDSIAFIEKLDIGSAKETLIQAQQDAEELFMQAD